MPIHDELNPRSVPGTLARMARLRRAINCSADVLGTLERYVAAALIVLMTVLYAFNVLGRFFAPNHASAFAWIDEAARYMLVWAVFLAAGLTLEVGRHVSVDIFQGKFGPGMTRVVFAAIDIVGVVFCAGAAFYSLQLTLFVAGTGQFSPTLGVPAFLLYAAPLVGFTSLAFRFLLRLTNVRDPRRSKVELEWLGSGAA
jgi:TRAP-type C4-dicarboxylate transport system permease small subunit